MPIPKVDSEVRGLQSVSRETVAAESDEPRFEPPGQRLGGDRSASCDHGVEVTHRSSQELVAERAADQKRLGVPGKTGQSDHCGLFEQRSQTGASFLVICASRPAHIRIPPQLEALKYRRSKENLYRTEQRVQPCLGLHRS